MFILRFLKKWLSEWKLSLKARYFLLINLIILTFGVVLVFTLISFIGLGRGDVVVLIVNFTEKPLTVVAPGQTKILSAFEVWSLEMDIVGGARIETNLGTLDVYPARTPVIYSWILGAPAVSNHCLAQTRLSLDKNFLGSKFEVSGQTPAATQVYRFDLPLNRLWWPTKDSASVLSLSNTNQAADYIFVFPTDCSTRETEDLLAQAKFWLNYNSDQVQTEYQKLQDLITDDPIYNDPGPILE